MQEKQLSKQLHLAAWINHYEIYAYISMLIYVYIYNVS